MRVFFSGIGGVGIGPLAQIAREAGYDVLGSDTHESDMTRRLAENGVSVKIGPQTADFLSEKHAKLPFDYFIYTAALPADHAELVAARRFGITCLKRDGLLARIIADKHLSMIAVAGTHGKTSTTGMMVWVMQQLGLPVSYSVGATLTFGDSGHFDPDSQYFVYECDEYDRNFLHFTPSLSLITTIDYDHPDTYPTESSYKQAFNAFINQSDHSLMWRDSFDHLHINSSDITVYDDRVSLDHLHLAGQHLRRNAFLVERAILRLLPGTPYHELIQAINSFPGTNRRMEKLADNLYSDYGHHPAEITATLQAAHEISDYVALVYQPHQNVRQHLIRSEYSDETFAGANEIYWLPTYLTREDSELETLTSEQLTENISNKNKLHLSEMDDELWRAIQNQRAQNHLVLIMGAGTIDDWARQHLAGRS